MKAIDYLERTGFRQGREFTPMDRRSFMLLDVLPFLLKRTWDDYALGAVQSLRPSWIRVIPSSGGIQMDRMDWRVTVWLYANGTIKGVEQEVVVGLPGCCLDATELNTWITGGNA